MTKTFSTLFLLFLLFILTGPAAAHADDQLFMDTLQLAQQGDSEAKFSLGLMYDTGNLVQRNPEQAVYWFAQAAAAGVAGACLYLGMKYEFGVHVGQDKKKAQHWYEQAALQGWSQAAFMLANLYLRLSPADRIRGCAWMTIADDQGFPGADQGRQQHCLDLSTHASRKMLKLVNRLRARIYPAEPASGTR